MSNPRTLVTLVIAAVAITVDCGEGTGPAPTTVDNYLRSLPEWAAYAPLLPSNDTASGDTTTREEVIPEVVDGVLRDVRYVCTSTPYSLTETPAEIVMYEPNASIMWAGSLIQGRSYKGGQGSFEELPIRQRAPLRLSIDLLTGENFAVVEHPSLTTVQSAIGDLIQRAQDGGHRSGTSINFDSRLTYATKQAALKLGLSAHWLGGSAHATLNVQHNASQHTLIAYFVQKMFTISIELPQSPGALFSSDFTADLLNEQIAAEHVGPNNLPVYLASITYGRTLMYSLTSTYSEDRMRAAISASFNGLVGGGSGYSEAQLRETLAQNNIRVIAIGGEGQNILDLITQGNLEAYFSTDAPLTTARPISYQLNYLGDNKLARVSETTTYDLDACNEVPDGDIISDFEVDNEDWALEGATTADATRGSRAPVDGDWFIRGTDGTSGTMYFRAPGKFRGDKAAYYGGHISYFARWLVDGGFGNGSAFAANDVIIIGANGNTLTYRFGIDDSPEDQWVFREVALDTRAAWRLAGQAATEQEIHDVLANVLQVKLRGEYRANATDIGYLDRVVMSKDPAP